MSPGQALDAEATVCDVGCVPLSRWLQLDQRPEYIGIQSPADCRISVQAEVARNTTARAQCTSLLL